MKYLKKFNESKESVSELEMNIDDILIDLKDQEYSYSIKLDPDKIEIAMDGLFRNVDIFKYKDIQDNIERVDEYLISEGFTLLKVSVFTKGLNWFHFDSLSELDGNNFDILTLVLKYEI